MASIFELVEGNQTLIVVSTDLSHYLNYSTALQRDKRTALAIERLAAGEIMPGDACSCYALRGFLRYADKKRLNLKRLDLRNSGDTAGDTNRVVGYRAWISKSD